MSNSDSRFMRDEELRVLLNKWNAPEAPGSLDQRVAASYRQSISSLDPQRDSEVVKMKFCSTCQEQFADRFSFCPVDGTPLSAAAVPTVAPPTTRTPVDVESSYPMSETVSQTPKAAVPPPPVQAAPVIPAAPIPSAPVMPAAPIQSASVEPKVEPVAAPPKVADPEPAVWPPHVVPKITVPLRPRTTGAVHHEMIGEYHPTMLADKGLLPRLGDAFTEVGHNYQLTWPEFKRDPMGFTRRSVQGYGKMVGSFLGARNTALALLIAFGAIGAIVGLLFIIDKSQSGITSRLTLIAVGAAAFAALIALFATWLGRDSGVAVMGAKPADSTNVISGIAVAFV